MNEFAFVEIGLNMSDIPDLTEMGELLEPFVLTFALVTPVLLGAAYVGARFLLRTHLQRGSNGPRNRHPEMR